MTEADTPPPRSWPPLFYFFSVGNRLIESICHLGDTRRSIITLSMAVIWTSWEFWEPLADESLKPCQKLKQQYLSLFEKATNYLSFNPIPGWHVLPILTKLVQLCTQQIFELVTAFYWTQNHGVSAFCRLSHRPTNNSYKYLWCKSEKRINLEYIYFWFPEPLPLVDIRPV